MYGSFTRRKSFFFKKTPPNEKTLCRRPFIKSLEFPVELLQDTAPASWLRISL